MKKFFFKSLHYIIIFSFFLISYLEIKYINHILLRILAIVVTTYCLYKIMRVVDNKTEDIMYDEALTKMEEAYKGTGD